ncbi:acyl-CoA-binding protein [Polaribacter sp.]|nr:acyl-CoA-binding protein [Polaribacter sp.]
MPEDLDIAFESAFQKISNLKTKLPPDIMLKFYAYFKQATQGDYFEGNTSSDVINAFKFNAWIQLNGMSQEQAKKEYVFLAESI